MKYSGEREKLHSAMNSSQADCFLCGVLQSLPTVTLNHLRRESAILLLNMEPSKIRPKRLQTLVGFDLAG